MKLRVLLTLALAPMLLVAQPSFAGVATESACGTWSVGEQEDEGGPVLTAWVCASDDPEVTLSMTCFDHEVGLRYDLAHGTDLSPDGEVSATVVFAVGDDSVGIDMRFEEMDGFFAAQLPADEPLLEWLQAGKSLHIEDAAGAYASHDIALSGSRHAIGTLLSEC